MLMNAAAQKEFEERIRKEFARDGKIAAIKMYRTEMGGGLKEAKDAVEQLLHIMPEHLTLSWRDKQWVRTNKVFSLASLIGDNACESGLTDLLSYFRDRPHNSLYHGLTNMEFVDWWRNGGGNAHAQWLDEFNYIDPSVVHPVHLGDRFTIRGCEYILARVTRPEDARELWGTMIWALVGLRSGNVWSDSIAIETSRFDLTKEEFSKLCGSARAEVEDILQTKVKRST